jgi:hypothetical protein
LDAIADEVTTRIDPDTALLNITDFSAMLAGTLLLKIRDGSAMLAKIKNFVQNKKISRFKDCHPLVSKRGGFFVLFNHTKLSR